jgi:hypothetical protein
VQFNPLELKLKQIILKHCPYLKENTTLLHYKDQRVNAV